MSVKPLQVIRQIFAQAGEGAWINKYMLLLEYGRQCPPFYFMRRVPQGKTLESFVASNFANLMYRLERDGKIERRWLSKPNTVKGNWDARLKPQLCKSRTMPPEQVVAIRAAFDPKSRVLSIKALAKKYAVTVQTIRRCVDGKVWRDIPSTGGATLLPAQATAGLKPVSKPSFLKLTQEQKEQIVKDYVYGARGHGTDCLARRHGVSRKTVRECLRSVKLSAAPVSLNANGAACNGAAK